jgi:hypothetical protein
MFNPGNGGGGGDRYKVPGGWVGKWLEPGTRPGGSIVHKDPGGGRKFSDPGTGGL